MWEKVTRVDVKERGMTGDQNGGIDGECKCGLGGEGTVGGRDTKPGCVQQVTCQKHPT